MDLGARSGMLVVLVITSGTKDNMAVAIISDAKDNMAVVITSETKGNMAVAAINKARGNMAVAAINKARSNMAVEAINKTRDRTVEVAIRSRILATTNSAAGATNSSRATEMTSLAVLASATEAKIKIAANIIIIDIITEKRRIDNRSF
jgi:hypothetical protein